MVHFVYQYSIYKTLKENNFKVKSEINKHNCGAEEKKQAVNSLNSK